MRKSTRTASTWMGVAVVVGLVLAVLSDASGALEGWSRLVDWCNRLLGLPPDSFLVRFRGGLFVLFLLGAAALILYVQALVRRSQDGKRDGTSEAREGIPASSWEARARAEYLEILGSDVEQRIKASIHRALFLDLGLGERDQAVQPWHYVAPAHDQPEKVFTSFDEAFDHFKGRILLLGGPGSGKTTTLLHIARRLLAEAREDPGAPIPVLLNLSSFRPPDERKSGASPHEAADPRENRAFDRWLADELGRLPVPGPGIAAQWIEQRQVALLLDGLDEVGEDRQPELLRLLNESFLPRHFVAPVVVCSRVIEYERLLGTGGRLTGLKGAVLLRPPDRQQIAAYLKAAGATGLAAALAGDDAFYELAQTPLTLSMMTLSYGGVAPARIPVGLSLLERRGHLFDTYVDRMMQRTARRRAGKPFDLNPALDEPTAYSRERVDRSLGWLAVRLSERSRTAFSPLFSVLWRSQEACPSLGGCAPGQGLPWRTPWRR